MSGLSPGTVLPKDMDQRQWATWNRQQAIDTVVSDAIADHVAEADPHTQYAKDTDLTAAIAALNLASGTYTPTLTNVNNLTSSTALQCQYLRVGATVTVSGAATINVTAGAASTQLGISLPVASSLGAVEDCGGVGSTATESFMIFADITNDRAQLQNTASVTGSQTVYFSFSYQVI
jgi:hypothetical protein